MKNKDKKNDLIGLKFGKLTVLSKAESIYAGKKTPRFFGAWNCKCDCGNMKIVKTAHLNQGNVTSCGCLYDEYGKSLLPGQTFNRLTTISYKNGKWLCLCSCGNYITLKPHTVSGGNTKSCGCLVTEINSKKSSKLIEGRRKFKPLIASARRVWKSYCSRDLECVGFDDFYKISQMNCFYCNNPPSNKYNNFDAPSSRGSIKAKTEGLFIYNGLDRLDSSKNHTLENIVPCCYICNRSKSDRQYDDFIKHLSNLENKNINDFILIPLKLPNNSYKLTTIKIAFRRYNEGDLSLEDFYSLSKNPCFYCNVENSLISNYAKRGSKSSQKAIDNADFIYNGIDRIDSNLPHNKDNVVPCCKYCNFAKSNLIFEDFQNWIKRVKEFVKST